jgi:aminoglycoside phosphotransferase (APT) family kinase protein
MRAGEELDVAAVDRWLRTVAADLDGALPEVTQYSGGASNWTYRLRYRTRDLVLRRPPAGTKAASAHDMAREYHIQRALAPAYPLVPRMVGLCEDPAVIGATFYVMDRIDGPIPRARLPEGAALTPGRVRDLCTHVIDALIALHQVDARVAALARFGKGPGYPRRQVEGWSARYVKARTWNVPTFAHVRHWLAERVPDDVAACVIHNDWRFDNVVLDPADPTRIVGVLDWEMATIGDPLMDLGSALAYWVHADDPYILRSTRRQPTDAPGMLRREEVAEYSLARTGLRPADWTFYEVFGLFRLAAIIQQIYYRYHHRQTRNPAFRHFWVLVNYFDWRCRSLIRRGPPRRAAGQSVARP